MNKNHVSLVSEIAELIPIPSFPGSHAQLLKPIPSFPGSRARLLKPIPHSQTLMPGTVTVCLTGIFFAHTQLHVAAANGYRETARLLIDAGANIDKCDDTGYTPLHVAVKFGQVGHVTENHVYCINYPSTPTSFLASLIFFLAPPTLFPSSSHFLHIHVHTCVAIFYLPTSSLPPKVKLVKLLLNRNANPRALSFQKELPIGEPFNNRSINIHFQKPRQVFASIYTYNSWELSTTWPVSL